MSHHYTHRDRDRDRDYQDSTSRNYENSRYGQRDRRHEGRNGSRSHRHNDAPRKSNETPSQTVVISEADKVNAASIVDGLADIASNGASAAIDSVVSNRTSQLADLKRKLLIAKGKAGEGTDSNSSAPSFTAPSGVPDDKMTAMDMGSFEAVVAAVAEETEDADDDEADAATAATTTTESYDGLSPAAAEATAVAVSACVTDPLQQLLARNMLDAPALQRLRQDAQWVKSRLLEFMVARKDDAGSVSVAQRLTQLVVQAESTVKATVRNLHKDEALRLHLGYNSNSSGAALKLEAGGPEDGYSEDNAFVYYCAGCSDMVCVCDAPVGSVSMHVRAEDGAIVLNECTRKFNKFAGRTQTRYISRAAGVEAQTTYHCRSCDVAFMYRTAAEDAVDYSYILPESIVPTTVIVKACAEIAKIAVLKQKIESGELG